MRIPDSWAHSQTRTQAPRSREPPSPSGEASGETYSFAGKVDVYRFKLIRTVPLYALTNDFFTCAEEKLLSASREATSCAQDLAFELSITDKDGEETMDSFACYPGDVPDNARAAEFTVASESSSFLIALTVHRENLYECQLVVSASGLRARTECLGIHDTLVRELSSFALRESVNPSAEARSFSLKVQPMAISEADLIELERHLIQAAASHTRHSVSSAAQELRVTLELGHKSESYSSIGQLEGRYSSLASFKQLSLRLWEWNDERKFQADITLDRVKQDRCELRIDCVGEGARSAAEESRTWIEDWMRGCSTGVFPRYILRGWGRTAVILLSIYSLLFSLIAFLDGSQSIGILFGSLGVGLLCAYAYGPILWPYTRLTSPREEARRRYHMGIFKFAVGSLLLASIIVPTLLQIFMGGDH